MTRARALWRLLRLDRRPDEDEWMDTVPLAPEVADRTLRFLEMTNRRFGGTDVIIRRLQRWRSEWPADRAVTVLDVGTGAADIPRALVRWGRSSGVILRVTAVDSAADVAAVARARVGDAPEISIEHASLADVAASGRRFDYVVASLFLHHVAPRDQVAALLAFDRLASRGIIVSDLHRSPLTLAVVGMVGALAGNAIVRHDGPLSVRRAFTVADLSDLAQAAGIDYLRAASEGPFRVSLAGERAAHA